MEDEIKTSVPIRRTVMLTGLVRNPLRVWFHVEEMNIDVLMKYINKTRGYVTEDALQCAMDDKCQARHNARNGGIFVFPTNWRLSKVDRETISQSLSLQLSDEEIEERLRNYLSSTGN